MVSNIYSLPQIDFVGGSTQEFVFNVYGREENPQPFTLSGCEANFSIIDYVNKTGEPIVSEKMEIRRGDDGTNNVLFLELKPAKTLDLFGKYIYQITLRDVDNNADIPKQGILYIHNNINKAFLRG